MKPIHTFLAVLVAIIWGIAFVVSKIGLELHAPQLTALRFIVAALAVVVVPRPNIPWSTLIAIGLTVFTGQFLLQFFGIAYGMPAGLTAVVVQTQALFTVLFATLVIGDRPTSRQLTGMLTAFVGLLMIGLTLGTSIPLLAFALTLASAISWATGNVLVKRLPKVNTLHLMVWASLVPPLPAFAISVVLDGPTALFTAVAHASWLGLFAPLSRCAGERICLRDLGPSAATLFDRRRRAFRLAGAGRWRHRLGVHHRRASVQCASPAWVACCSGSPSWCCRPTCSGLSTVPAPSTTDPHNAERHPA